MALLVAAGTPVYAAVYDWSFSDPAGDTGSGTLTVTGATSPFTMTDIKGTYDGSNINGPLPPGIPGGCCGDPGNDNLVFFPATRATPFFLDPLGIGFSTSSLSGVNIFFFDTYGVYNGNSANLHVGGTFSLTIPEPSTWAMMLLGFACLGVAGYRRGLQRTPGQC